MWTGERCGRGSKLPRQVPRLKFSILSRGSFARRRNRRILRILRLLPPPPIFARAAMRHKQKLQGSDFCSGKWDFPTQKSAPVPDARGDFADFPNRQNRSALADLKTLWVFNLPVGVDFYARGLRLSRALPGVGLTGCPAEILLRGVVAFDTPPGSDFIARGLRPSRALPWWGQAAMADVGLSSLALPGADQCAPIIAHFGSNEKRFRRI